MIRPKNWSPDACEYLVTDKTERLAARSRQTGALGVNQSDRDQERREREPSREVQPQPRGSDVTSVLARRTATASFRSRPVRSSGHSVTVPGRTSTTTFRNPTRIGAAFPGREVSRRSSGLNSTRMR
jgi:hypothetical protein